MKTALNKFCLLILPFILFLGFFVAGCKNGTANSRYLENGYYTAEMMEPDPHGWKEFISINVKNGRIVTVEYNAKNTSGFIRSWDPAYMREMKTGDFIYPNKYTREYAFALLNFQDLNRIDVISGATQSYDSFILLSRAVIEQARTGNKQIAMVEQP